MRGDGPAPWAPIRDPADLRPRLDALRAGFSLDAVPDVAGRRRRLDALAEALRARRERVLAAISEDFGHRAEVEILTGDYGFALDAVAHLRRNLARWATPRRRMVTRPLLGRSEVRREPKGVVGVVSPWNYPLQLALVPLATALAAGNRVMLKPAERTPRTAELLAEIVSDALPMDEASVALGEADMGAAFAALPFDHLFYTGNAEVGRKVMQAAAANLTPVTLELGGKSPAVMMPDADPKAHGAMVAWGRWYGAGQTCVACDHLWVPRGQGGLWADAVLDRARGFLAGPGAPDYTDMIDARARRRIEAMVEEARAAGAEVRALDLPASRGGAYRPTVVLRAPSHVALMREEVFGPVLPILEYDDPSDVVAAVARGPHPLAAYAFGRDAAAARALVLRMRSGGAAVNAAILHLAVHHAPFGGVGGSGMGAYHGERGFQEFSHERTILTAWGGGAVGRMMLPPYAAPVRRAIGWMTR